jgi:hypothetical protein
MSQTCPSLSTNLSPQTSFNEMLAVHRPALVRRYARLDLSGREPERRIRILDVTHNVIHDRTAAVHALGTRTYRRHTDTGNIRTVALRSRAHAPRNASSSTEASAASAGIHVNARIGTRKSFPMG